jgi:hypothetical protein
MKMLEEIMDIKLTAISDVSKYCKGKHDVNKIRNYSISDELKQYRELSGDTEFGKYISRGLDVLKNYFAKDISPGYIFSFLLTGK